MAAVPYPKIMKLNGARNLAAHFPTNGLPPDAGEMRSSIFMVDSQHSFQVLKCTTDTFAPIPICTWM